MEEEERTDFDYAVVGGEILGVLSAVSTKESYADLELPSIEGRRGGCISKSSKERARFGNAEDLHMDNRHFLRGTVLFAICREGELSEACGLW